MSETKSDVTNPVERLVMWLVPNDIALMVYACLIFAAAVIGGFYLLIVGLIHNDFIFKVFDLIGESYT